MKLLNYVRSLDPTYERREIVGALHNIQEELVQYTLPCTQDVTEAFAKVSLKSNLGKRLERELNKYIRHDGALPVLHKTLDNINTLIPEIESQIKKSFGFTVSTYKLKFDQANLMKLVETLGFYIRYHRKLYLSLVAEESAVIGKATPQRWSKAEKQWLDEGLAAFVQLTPLMLTPAQELKNLMASMSNAEMDESTIDVAVQSLGQKKVDPFRFERGLFGVRVNNPMFSLGKAIAEMQVKRYQAAKEEHTALQLRLQEYRESAASPSLQRLIERTESRIEQLDYRISRIEEENRYDDE